MFLYHVNIGFPIVDAGSRIVLPDPALEPAGDYPVDDFLDIHAPQRGYEERVASFRPRPDPSGVASVGIVNEARGLGLALRFRPSQLPHPFIWRMLGEGSYAVALEPSTNRVSGRLAARESGELIELEPGETRRYELDLEVLEGAPTLGAFAEAAHADRGRVTA